MINKRIWVFFKLFVTCISKYTCSSKITESKVHKYIIYDEVINHYSVDLKFIYIKYYTWLTIHVPKCLLAWLSDLEQRTIHGYCLLRA